MGFSAHVVQRPYLSFTTFNFDHDYDYDYDYNYNYDHHGHYTTRATYLAVQIYLPQRKAMGKATEELRRWQRSNKIGIKH